MIIFLNDNSKMMVMVVMKMLMLFGMHEIWKYISSWGETYNTLIPQIQNSKRHTKIDDK